MAKGWKCPCCGAPMFAQREEEQQKGRWVTYVCQAHCAKEGRKCTHSERKFEAYAG